MKISLNTIQQMCRLEGCADDLLPNGVDALVTKVGEQLGAVEEVVDFGSKFDGVHIVKVVRCWKHENSDHLSVCLIDDGGNTPTVNRDENGLVQVVCGASNVREGMLAVWLAPGQTVPDSVDTEPFVLGARELRGVMSNGMLASLKELGLGDDHTGILEVDEDVQPGALFAETYNLASDVVIDIENKMFTHRPDCFGTLGVAREIAGIQHLPFKSPQWYTPSPDFPNKEADLPLHINNQLPELAPRFSAITMADVEVKPSPLWLKIELAKVGIKSINNIVDYTNFFMVLTGQPLHAYDYDKVKGLNSGEATLVIRHPHENEEIALLNGKTITPRGEAVMIATDQKLIGIGGVIGGTDTEVHENTRNIILECANFDMYNIRKTSMEHGLFTDAVTRFNKGQSLLQTLAVLAKIVDEIKQHAGGKVASVLQDVQGELQDNRSVQIRTDFINSRLGLELAPSEIGALLKNVEFEVSEAQGELTVFVPFWRTDIEIPEDIVEEVGRLYGFDKLKRELPKRSITPVAKDPMFALKSQIRDELSKAGANEVLTYSFVHGDLLDKVAQDKTKAFKISNALSPDLQYYRMSLTPSLLDKVHANVKAGYDTFAIFEIGKAHIAGEPDPAEPAVPKEVNSLSYIYTNAKEQKGAAYYNARLALETLERSLGSDTYIDFKPLQSADLYGNPWVIQMTAPYEPTRSAVLCDANGLIWGVVGEFKSSIRRSLKLPEKTAAFEVDPLLFIQNLRKTSYKSLPRFPKVTQDITLRVANDMQYQTLRGVVYMEIVAAKPLDTRFTVDHLGIFKAEGDTHKNISFRISLASYDKTMREHEVSEVLDAVAAKAHEVCGAERV